MNRKPWTHSKCCRCGRSALHLSFLVWQNKMKEILFEVSTSFKYAWRRSSWDAQHLVQIQIQTKHLSKKNIQQIHVGNAMFRGTESIGKALPTNSKPPLSSCKVNSTFKLNLSNRALMAFTFQGHSKGTRAWQNIIQSLWSKILFIKFRKMLGRYHSTNPEE